MIKKARGGVHPRHYYGKEITDEEESGFRTVHGNRVQKQGILTGGEDWKEAEHA